MIWSWPQNRAPIMRTLTLTSIGRPAYRRLISAVTTCAYLVTAIGFPAPAAATSGSACGQRVCCCGSEAKCRASGCGCNHSPLPQRSQSSCCHSSRKKDVVKQSSSEAPSGKICCSKPSAVALCPKTSSAKKVDCGVQPTEKVKPKSIRWVVGISAQKCGGGATEWVSAQAALPGSAPMQWQPSWPFRHILHIVNVNPLSASVEVLDPPPRTIVAA